MYNTSFALYISVEIFSIFSFIDKLSSYNNLKLFSLSKSPRVTSARSSAPAEPLLYASHIEKATPKFLQKFLTTSISSTVSEENLFKATIILELNFFIFSI